MLTRLSIRDIVLIERLDIDFLKGLAVLTGETGAGKSILLDCLGLVLGWKGRADTVRLGAAKGEVSAEFDLDIDHPARLILSAAELPCHDTLILRRVSGSDGRKQAFINDRRATAETIQALAEVFVEIHGQHDDRGLLDPKGHSALLDQFAAENALVHAVRAAWRHWQNSERSLAAARQELATAQRDADYLRNSATELAKLMPALGEAAILDTRRRLMQASARIRSDVAKAAQALALDGAEGLIGDATRWLEAASIKAEGTLDAPLQALSRLAVELAEAQSGIERALEVMDFDPNDLETTEERLFALRGLARKHNVQPDDLVGLATEFHGRLVALEIGEDRIVTLKHAVKAAQEAYFTAAGRLRLARNVAAQKLDQAVQVELAPLKLERAKFITQIDAAEPGPEGIDRVTFTVSTNPGSPAGPINKIASGGELSRFMLALKVCLAADSCAMTMIFDEIDRGVGGATADAVGRRLADLAQGSQILVVTHSPQVAAKARHHLLVSKLVSAGNARTDVGVLSEAGRNAEIARMLAGDVVTDAARAAARELLAG